MPFRTTDINSDGANAGQLNALIVSIQNRLISSCGVTIGTIKSGLKTALTGTYTVNGKVYSLAAADPMWTLGVAGSNTTVLPGHYQKYALCIGEDGIPTVQEAVPSPSSAGVNWDNICQPGTSIPCQPLAGICYGVNMAGVPQTVVATLLIETGAGETFVPGTTELDAINDYLLTNALDSSLAPLLANLAGDIYGIDL